MDRRKFPRIKISKNKSGFVVKLIIKRIFFADKIITCKLRDLSEGGVSVYINGNTCDLVTEKDIGRDVILKAEGSEIPFNRKGRLSRVIMEDNNRKILVLVFK